jgi:hypothetical protein
MRGTASRARGGSSFARFLAVVGVAWALAACTAIKLGYENLPWVLGWQADSYLDLDGAQEDLLSRKVEEAQRWHRKTQLPAYMALVKRVEDRVQAGPFDVAQIADWQRQGLALWPPIAEHLAPAVAEIGLTLRPEQLAHLKRSFAKANDKYNAEHRQKDPQARLEARVKRMTERAETFLGKLSDAQRERLRATARAVDGQDDARFQQRLARQAAVLAQLTSLSTERPSLEQATGQVRATLAGLFAPATLTPSVESDQLWVDLVASASPEQRQRMVTRLAQYRDDFSVLARR